MVLEEMPGATVTRRSFGNFWAIFRSREGTMLRNEKATLWVTDSPIKNYRVHKLKLFVFLATYHLNNYCLPRKPHY